MNKKKERRGIVLYRRANKNESIEILHRRIMEGLSKLDAPLGLKDSKIPEVPKFGSDDLITFYDAKNNKTKGVKLLGEYSLRSENYEKWDKLIYNFNSTYRLINYHEIINNDICEIIKIFTPYDMVVDIHYSYSGAYREGTTPETRTYNGSINTAYNKLINSGIIPDYPGKNLFTLQPVMYFSGEMCKEVIKLNRDEIIKRLEGKVLKIFPLLDGVYIIFNDKIEMTYEEFKKMNDTFKPILDLI